MADRKAPRSWSFNLFLTQVQKLSTPVLKVKTIQQSSYWTVPRRPLRTFWAILNYSFQMWILAAIHSGAITIRKVTSTTLCNGDSTVLILENSFNQNGRLKHGPSKPMQNASWREYSQWYWFLLKLNFLKTVRQYCQRAARSNGCQWRWRLSVGAGADGLWCQSETCNQVFGSFWTYSAN